MNGLFDSAPLSSPPLPAPERERWQPLRLGLVELFHYDSEEFWFRDGHLLLRGNNGTGKSKVLSLTLPFLLDAQLRPSRIEPDGDPGKKMAWNLLMNSYPRRMGYTWIELGRLSPEGEAHFLTLGAGLSAVDGRPQVETWFFVLDDAAGGARIGRDLWLTSEQRVVLGRERLREAIEGRGQVFETAGTYRRAVDERLFHLGQRRYEALMDTLIQLRHPQLSKKPDEAGLSHALTEALPPLPVELLGDVAEALHQLEEDRRQLEELRELADAVQRFDRRYRIYAGMLARRQARQLRQAQTEFDNASQERNLAQARRQEAQLSEQQARADAEEAERTLLAARTRLETLQSDPTMRDANRLEHAEQDARKRGTEAAAAGQLSSTAEEKLRREQGASHDRRQAVEQAGRGLAAARAESGAHAELAGLASFGAGGFETLDGESLAALGPQEFEAAAAAVRGAVADRREHLALLQRRHGEIAQMNAALLQREEHRRERRAELEDAAERRAEADEQAERAGSDLLDAWTAHCAALVQLRFDAAAALAALGDWVLDPRGESPARQAFAAARSGAERALARRQLELEARREALQQEAEALGAEQSSLQAGRDTAPPSPHTRSTGSRENLPGAPLWQLVDFSDALAEDARPKLEAALEASGLLDAWVSPDGRLLAAAGDGTWHDSRWTLRPPVAGRSLGHWLEPAAEAPADAPAAVSASLVKKLLAGIGGTEAEDADAENAEAWISPRGHYRLGALTGSWDKEEAVFIGHAARVAARRRRLEAIGRQLELLALELAHLGSDFESIEADRREAAREWNAAPSEQGLHAAHLQAAGSAREYQAALLRLERSAALCREAELQLEVTRAALERDAADLRLPHQAEALPPIETALHRFSEAFFAQLQAAREWRRALPELHRQEARETEAALEAAARRESLGAALLEAKEAATRLEVLREAVGSKVDDLLQKLSAAKAGVRSREEEHRLGFERWRVAGQTFAVAETQAAHHDSVFDQRAGERAAAVTRLQQFAASSLLSSALPALELPDPRAAWTIDPALALARRIEQGLSQVKDDDDAWSRVQKQITEDLQELQRTLSALGHQAPAEPSEWGLVVHILFHNRAERPDRLTAKLAEDIGQRTELLSANERNVLENHLQAEIAAEIQRLLRAAEQQVADVNRELYKRPTSTGVRFRLQWLPLADNEGAPLGLGIARERLLNTAADLWTAEDRRAIGHLLQRRIAEERELAETAPARGGGESGSLEQLARALDYRRWHQFRVQRLQDGQWRKLSGPASSGERALGLTVPLFAAIASFYSRGCHPLAPRLMLLDEAFAGIDDDARAHCMGLIRDFDLDFVITSEREWACYAELPGVAICQLQRHEGIDAVHVSRWTWDGRAKRREEDPNRRFPPA